MFDLKAIGQNIAAIRHEKSLTQSDLAAALSVSTQAVSKWENGINLPEASLLLKLSAVFGVSIDTLLLNNRVANITDIDAFLLRNTTAPAKKFLTALPRLSRWSSSNGIDMFYSFPAMMTAALCAAERYDRGETGEVSVEELNERFGDMMHLTGIGYGFLWRDQGNLIEELWRIDDFSSMAKRVMGYYGRDYLWLNRQNSTPEEMRRLLLWSVDRGHPVMMEWAGGLPEFSIVTGYEDDGNTLFGWTYCEECAPKMTSDGKFVVPARWTEDMDFEMLIVGERKEPTYTDRDAIVHALEVLDQTEPWSKEYLGKTFAGDPAVRRWREVCDTAEGCEKTFRAETLYVYALERNTIYAQTCVMRALKTLGSRLPKAADDAVCQITIAVGNLINERARIGSLQGEAFEKACRKHVDHLLTYRGWLRGWLGTIRDKMDGE